MGRPDVKRKTRFEPKISQKSGVPIKTALIANINDDGITAKSDNPAQMKMKRRCARQVKVKGGNLIFKDLGSMLIFEIA
jgi:hypothetical protein